MSKLQIRNSLLLFLTATIWGVSFVAQRVGMDYVGPFTFTSVRSLIGALSLLPVVRLFGRSGSSGRSGRAAQRALAPEARKKQARQLLLGGALCGVILCAGTTLQQFAMRYTTVGKAGFITALYIVIVPIIGRLLGKKCGRFVWLGVLVALAGLYFLCVTESFAIGVGDVLLFIGSIVFALHILVIDHFTQRVDGLRMSFIQCAVCGAVAAVPMLLLERPAPSAILAAWLPLLYAGALSCGVGYTLQILAQRGMNPTVASLILSLESVMSVLAGWLLIGQRLSVRELTGCALMFAAILLAQVPSGLTADRPVQTQRGDCRARD